MLILDRTGSMLTPGSPASARPNVKDATLAVLGYLNPKNESIALGGPAAELDDDADVHRRQRRRLRHQRDRRTRPTSAAPNTTWMVAPFPPTERRSNDYQIADGTLNPTARS